VDNRSIVRLIISLITGIVLYLIPAILWLIDDLSGVMLMFLYMVESIIAVFLTIVCVLLLAPHHETPKVGNYDRKSKLIKNFLVVSSGFIIGCVIFLTAFAFLVLKVPFDFEEIKFAFVIIAGFQLFEFVSNLYLMRPLTLKKAEYFLSESLGGVFVIFLCTFIGFFLAMFSESWFVYPFLILHAIIVIGSPIQFFWKGRNGIENLSVDLGPRSI
jgi:hypothetical protein